MKLLVGYTSWCFGLIFLVSLDTEVHQVILSDLLLVSFNTSVFTAQNWVKIFERTLSLSNVCDILFLTLVSSFLTLVR